MDGSRSVCLYDVTYLFYYLDVELLRYLDTGVVYCLVGKLVGSCLVGLETYLACLAVYYCTEVGTADGSTVRLLAYIDAALVCRAEYLAVV